MTNYTLMTYMLIQILKLICRWAQMLNLALNVFEMWEKIEEQVIILCINSIQLDF